MQNPYVFDVGDAEALEGRAASVFDIAAAEAEEELEAVVSKVLDERRAARKRRRLRRRIAVHARERKMKVPNTIQKRKAFAKMDSWEQRRLMADWVMARWELRLMESSEQPPPAPEWAAAAVLSPP